MKLNLEIIRSYGFKETTSKPDWDDIEVTFELPNGLELSTLTVCNNEPTEADCLEGLDGYIWIETKEELDHLIGMTFEEVIEQVAEVEEDFDKEDYI